MTVMSDALLKNVKNIGMNNDATVGNVVAGGQLGIGAHLPQLDSVTPLVFPPVVPVITHIPTMFKRFDGMGSILKALVERHTKAITGIDFGYELEVAEGMTLADGQVVSVPTKNKRSAISPNMTFPELPGNLVWNFYEFWLSLISHPDTHFSKLAAIVDDPNFDPHVFSSYCMDICFIQFDQTFLPKNIISAVFVTTMFPKNTGTMNIKKEVGAVDSPERAIDFNGIVQHNSSTLAAGRQIAEVLQLHRADYDKVEPIATEIEESAKDLGVQSEIEQIVSSFS